MDFSSGMISRWFRILLAAALIGCFGVDTAMAINQIETKYFTIIYDENGEYTAGEIAKFCDDIYEKLMAQYDSFTDDPQVTCIVNDAVDLANGYALYFQNTITIFATNMDYELRGQSSWLRNVFVHEMTHMITLKRAAKGPVNFVALGGGKYNDNPDLSVDVAFYHLSQPAWFSEGVAQLGAETFGSETWDTHRDMLLRTAWYENSLLTREEMEVLEGKTQIGAEEVYNQGYSLVKYIREKYGDRKVKELNSSTVYLDFTPAVRRVLGVGLDEIYDGWRADLDRRYATFRKREFTCGEKIEDEGSADYYPALSPDGRYLAWLSNRGKDYAITDLMITDLTTDKTRKIVEDVDYSVSWSHDSASLIYVKRPKRSPRFYDIFVYDLKTGNEHRISKSMRARDPSFSPGDSLIVFVRNVGGNNDIALMKSDGTGLRYLTATHDGTQFYSPSFSPDGSKILFGAYRQDMDRDIGMIDTTSLTYRYHWEYADSTSGFADSTLFAENSDFRLVVGTRNDERQPRFLPDGSGIVYVSDWTGVFNIYRLDFRSARVTRLTDVYGGAFSPDPGSDGFVYYAGYTANDFSIYRVSLASKVEYAENIVEARDYLTQPERFDLSKHFTVNQYRRKRILNAVVPTFSVGPSFIGSRFGLNVVDVGAQVYVSDLLGYDAFIVSGSVGRNLKEDVGLNNSFSIYYERAMVPVTSSSYTHAPRLFAEASRMVINNHIQLLEAAADTAYYLDRPDLGLDNVLYDIHYTANIADKYRDEFRRYSAGVFVPLANRHYLTFEAGYRQYYETLLRRQEIRDFSNFFLDNDNITADIPGAGGTYVDETRFFTDMNYFTSSEFGVSYLYTRRVPSADDVVSPKGSTVLLGFRHLRSTYADSLVDQPLLYAPLGINLDGSIALGQYNPDMLLDEFRPFNKGIDINEFTVMLLDYRKLPYWRHTFNSVLFTAYRDIYIRDWRKNEGVGYNWPLKYYLGGGNILSGYPYFAFWGSKILYSNFGYTFPIRERIGKSVAGVNVQRLYGNVFFEAGHVWNFRRLSVDKLKEGSFKRDIGFELRLSMTAYYRFPLLFYARIAWPLDDMGDSPYTNDARRYYFGLEM